MTTNPASINPAMARALRLQGEGCGNVGSPFYARLLAVAADDYEAGGPVGGLLQPWAEAGTRAILEDAAPIRLLGALHELVLSGGDAELAAAWPRPEAPPADGALAWAAASGAIERHHERLAKFMTHEPQTNEVRRSICLLGGFLTVAAETGLPLRCFEVGASAGLNLNWDRFRYEAGPVAWGDPDARVLIDADWTGGPPPLDAPVRVAHRAACDRRPSPLTAEGQRRLLAYVWPDQFDRMTRLRAAMALAVDLGVQVEAADAVDWTRAVAAPSAGTASVVYHSVFWQYLPAASQAGLRAAVEAHGAAATADAPFAWLRMEPRGDTMLVMEVRLTLWPDGEERLLAEVHPHGAWVKWRR